MKKFMRFIVPLLLAVFIIASIGWYLFVYDRDFTRDILLSQARYHDLHGNARISAWFYDLAYDHSGRDENVAIELANQYKQDGNYTKAEFTLYNAINTSPTVELYTALCKVYVEQDKLLDAVNMLDNINDTVIKAELDALRPSAPATNYAPGFYSQYIGIQLESSADKLYYSAEGEYPTTSSSPFSEPITLPAGETVIYAIGVNNDGLVSPLTIVGYTVGGVIEPAIFMDPTMETAVRLALGTDEDELLYTNHLWEITEFTVPEGVVNYEDLKMMPYLKSLTIQGQNIDTLSSISSLSNLETLDLAGSRIPAEDLSYVASLPSLTKLVLSDCGLSTIANLAGAQNLTYLDLSKNTIRNLEALAPMTSLKELNMQHNALVALDALSGLNNLEHLDVSYNSLTTLDPLASCAKLNWLDAGNNTLQSVYGISGLSLLSYLSVDFNQLTDVSALANCTELTNLSFANNQITDISALSTLVKLDVLDFSYNTVEYLPDWQEGCTLRIIDGSYNALTSIDNLAGLANIAYIYMDYNQLTSVDAIAECYHLVQVNVYGNEISEVSALTDHDIIVNYDPTW